ILAQLLVVSGFVLFVQFQFACEFHDDLVRAAMHADNGIEQAAELVQPDMDGGIGYLAPAGLVVVVRVRSEEHTSELQSLMRNSYAVFCLKQQKTIYQTQ